MKRKQSSNFLELKDLWRCTHKLWSKGRNYLTFTSYVQKKFTFYYNGLTLLLCVVNVFAY